MVYTSNHVLEFPKDATITNVLLDYNIGGVSLDKPSIIDGHSGKVVYTYSSLRCAVRRMARYLQVELNVRKGSVVSLLAFNTVHYPVYVHAILAVGGVVSALNPLHIPQVDPLAYINIYSCTKYTQELAHALSIAQPSQILVAEELLGNVRAALKLSKALPSPHISILSLHSTSATENIIHIPETLQSGSIEFIPPIYADGEIEKELAFICFSSGTSGLPKGVKLSHGNVVSNVYMHSIYLSDMFHPGSVFAMVVPFFHILGLEGFTCLYVLNGAPIVVFPKFELQPLLNSIKRDKVTHLNVVPPIALQFLNNPLADKGDYNSLQCLMNAAAPLEQNLTDLLCKKLGVVLTQWYGLTEASPSVITQRPDQVHIRNTVGKLLPGISLKVLDTNLNECPHGVAGELCIKGPNVMQGYVGNEELTDDTIILDGYLRTGDIGYVDDNGYVFLIDRLKELIKVKGNQVAPAELEAVLRSHPQIDDAAVRGHHIPEEGTDVPVAFITTKVPAREYAALSCEVIKFIKTRVASYKKIYGVQVVDEIPRKREDCEETVANEGVEIDNEVIVKAMSHVYNLLTLYIT
ncbi:phenylacetyl- ligase [Phlyctema vagabunda]|uniref:Phenylacetyl- ligase n=1 Tax=Phlyctema vagabunda TaxID=108571 RepID=A0ABR4P4R1_9HELO